MNATEQLVQRRHTQAFINANPAAIVFKRIVEAADGMGGRTHTENTLAAQAVRIVPARTRAASLTYVKPTGEVISSKDQILVGMPSLDVHIKDRFEWMNSWFQISYIEADRSYETLCQIDQLGDSQTSTVG